MRKKDGAPPFLHHPPACLALFAKDGTDSMGRNKVVEAEARDIQRRLIEQLTQVWAENATFQRLMYKNRNQHRRAVYYRRLSQVRRDLQLLQSLGLVDVVESLVHWAVPGKQRAAPTKAAPSDTGLQGIDSKAVHRSTVQRRLLGSARLLQQMAEPILDASCQIAGLLSQSFFMPFALTMLALLARFRVLLLQVFYEVVAAFNLVAATSQHMQLAAPISAHSQNIGNEDVPVMLECHWDGVKLVLYEKLPPPPPPPSPTKLPIFVSDATLLSAAGWFIEDRSTISKEKLLETETAVLYERDEDLLLEASLDTLHCIGEDPIDRRHALTEAYTIPKVTRKVEQALTEINPEGETSAIMLKPVGEEVLADCKVSEKETLEDVLSGGEHLIPNSSKNRVAYISVQLGPSQIQSPFVLTDRLAMNFASIREDRNSKSQGKFPAHRSRGLPSDDGSNQSEVVGVEPRSAEEETSRAHSHLQVESGKVLLEPILSSPKNVDLNFELRERAGGAMAQECVASLSTRNLDSKSTSEADTHMSEDGWSLQMKNSEPGVEIAKDVAGLLCVQESERTCMVNATTYFSTGYNLVEHDNASEAVDSPAGIPQKQVNIDVNNGYHTSVTAGSEAVLNCESEDNTSACTRQVSNCNREPTLIHSVMEHEAQISGLSPPILKNYGSKSGSKRGDTNVTLKDPVRLIEEASIRDIMDVTTEALDAISDQSSAAPHGGLVQQGTYIFRGGFALGEIENNIGYLQEHECGAVEGSSRDEGQVGPCPISGHVHESSCSLDIGCDDVVGPELNVTSSSGALERVENVPVRSLTDPQALDMKAGTSSGTSNIDDLIDLQNQRQGNEVEAQGIGVVEVANSQHEARVSRIEAASISDSRIYGIVSSDIEDKKLRESMSSTPVVISSMQDEIISRVVQTNPSTRVPTCHQGKDIVEHNDETGLFTPPGSVMKCSSSVQEIAMPEAVASGSILMSGITSSKASSWFQELDTPRKKQGTLVESKRSRKAKRKASKFLEAAKSELDKNITSNIAVFSSTIKLHTSEPVAPSQSFGLLSGSGAKKEEEKEGKKSIDVPEDQEPKRMKMDDIFDMLLGN